MLKNIASLQSKIKKNKQKQVKLPIIEINLSNFKKNLLGLSESEILELLDKPNFKRIEHPASIWQYQSSICIVDIFFYTIKKLFIVDHVEIRSSNLQKVSEKKCFSSLIDSNFSAQDRGLGQNSQ